MTRYDVIPCPECEGAGWIDTTWGINPSVPGETQCRHCRGSGQRQVQDWDIESLVAAGIDMTREQAIARMVYEGYDEEDAAAIWRHYRKETES